MTRFFFHSANGAHHLDYEGMELPTIEAARNEAVRWMGELLTELSTEFWSVGRLVVSVTDANWKLFFSISTLVAEFPDADVIVERRRRRLAAAEQES